MSGFTYIEKTPGKAGFPSKYLHNSVFNITFYFYICSHIPEAKWLNRIIWGYPRTKAKNSTVWVNGGSLVGVINNYEYKPWKHRALKLQYILNTDAHILSCLWFKNLKGSSDYFNQAIKIKCYAFQEEIINLFCTENRLNY